MFFFFLWPVFYLRRRSDQKTTKSIILTGENLHLSCFHKAEICTQAHKDLDLDLGAFISVNMDLKLPTIPCDQISSRVHIIRQHTENTDTMHVPVTLIAVCATASIHSLRAESER